MPSSLGDECSCRKPKPGVLLRAIDEFDLKGRRTLYIGDDDRDLEAATAVGIPSIPMRSVYNQKFKYPDLLAAFSEVTELH